MNQRSVWAAFRLACALVLVLVLVSACASTERDSAAENRVATKPVATGDRFYIESGLPGDEPIAVRVVRGGDGDAVRPGQTAIVHYTGKFADGTKFDSSRDRDKPFRVTLGARSVIRGWELVIARMHVGDQWTVKIPYTLAYGERGRSPIIPPATDLFFDMELLAIE